MRYPKGHKEQTRRRIVDTASRAFRAGGVAEVSINDLMRELGLTHGGFYAHFPSKDALLADACRAGLTQAADNLLASSPDATTGDDARAVIERYLSTRHRDNRASGCVMPALAGDIAREPALVRDAFTEAFRAYVQRLSALLPAAPEQDAEERALVLISGMAGAVMLARAVDDPALSDRLLAACRTFYSEAFTGAPLPEGAAADDPDSEPERDQTGGDQETGGHP